MTLKEKIINYMPTNLTELEKSRYLYIELGKIVSFSTKFQNTDDLNFSLMMSQEVDIDKFNKNQVNCVIWSQLYSQLLTSVGIKNEIINEGHKYVEFYADGKRCVADATYGTYTDLARIHNDDDTCNFGVALFKNKHSNTISYDEGNMQLIQNIDSKLGYNTDEKENVMELKELLKTIRDGSFSITNITNGSEIDDDLIFKMEYLFSKLGVLKAGYYESKDYVRNMESYMLSEEERQRVKGVELKRTNDNHEVDIVQCLYVYGKDKIRYYLLTPFQPIRRVSKEELCRLAVLGYGIDDKTIPGVDFPKKFERGIISNKRIYKIYQNLKVKDLAMYNEEQCKKI